MSLKTLIIIFVGINIGNYLSYLETENLCALVVMLASTFVFSLWLTITHALNDKLTW